MPWPCQSPPLALGCHVNIFPGESALFSCLSCPSPLCPGCASPPPCRVPLSSSSSSASGRGTAGWQMLSSPAGGSSRPVPLCQAPGDRKWHLQRAPQSAHTPKRPSEGKRAKASGRHGGGRLGVRPLGRKQARQVSWVGLQGDTPKGTSGGGLGTCDRSQCRSRMSPLLLGGGSCPASGRLSPAETLCHRQKARALLLLRSH